MSSFNPDYTMTLGDLLGVDAQGNRITPVDASGNRRDPRTSPTNPAGDRPAGGSRNQALINRLEAAQKDTAAQLQQRVDRDRLTDLVETLTFARASGIPLSELQGLVRRSDLEAAGMLESAEARRRRRMEDRQKTAEFNRERARKARAEFKERRAAKKAKVEARKAEEAAERRRARDARMTPEERAAVTRNPFYTSGTAKPDMTPIDVDAENRMLMEDVLDFGPIPDASGPVGDPRGLRSPDPRGSKLPTARDPNAPTGKGSKLPTQAELPRGFRDPERYVPPGMSLEDVDAFSANFGPMPDGSGFTPSERLALGRRGAFIPTPPGESQRIADRFTRQQAAARRAAGLETLEDVDRMVNAPYGPGGIEGPNIPDDELRRRNFVGPREPLDQELSRIMDFGPTTDDISRGMTPSERLDANRMMGRQEYRTPPGESQRIADEQTRREAIRTGRGQGAMRPVEAPAITGGRDAMGRPDQRAQPRPPLRPDASGSAVRDQVLQDAMNFGPSGASPTQSIMDGGGLAGMLDVAPIQAGGMSFPSPMSQQEQTRRELKRIRQENADLADLDRLQSEIEKRRKLEERMRDRQPQTPPRPQNMFPNVPPVSQRF